MELQIIDAVSNHWITGNLATEPKKSPTEKTHKAKRSIFGSFYDLRYKRNIFCGIYDSIS